MFDEFEKIFKSQMAIGAGTIAISPLLDLAPGPVSKNLSQTTRLLGATTLPIAGGAVLKSLKYLNVEDDAFNNLF